MNRNPTKGRPATAAARVPERADDTASSPLAVRHRRRNFSLAVSNGAVYSGADAFIDPNTVLPLFLSRLTSSHALIGFGSSLASVGWFSPQLFMSNVLEGRARKLPIYRWSAVVRVAALAALAVMVPWFASRHPAALLVAFFVLFGVYALGGGFAGVSFMDVVAKTIPADRRGYLWSLRLGLGGLFAVAMGYIVRRVLAHWPFPTSFAITFGAAAFLVFVSLGLFSFCVEPPDSIIGERPTLERHVRNAFRVLRSDRCFQRLFQARMLFGLWAMSSPFYALFGMERLGLAPRTAGTFLITQTVGAVLSNLFWGRMSVSRGDVVVLRRVALLAVAAPAAAITAAVAARLLQAGTLPASFGVLPFISLGATFLLVGAVTSGIGVGYPNLLLTVAPEGRRTAYIGFMNTFIAPIVVLPTVGGLVVDGAGFLFVFGASAVFALSARASVLRLCESR